MGCKVLGSEARTVKHPVSVLAFMLTAGLLSYITTHFKLPHRALYYYLLEMYVYEIYRAVINNLFSVGQYKLVISSARLVLAAS